MNAQSSWQTPMTEAAARAWRGDDAFDSHVALGASHCACRMAGAWDANEPDSYGYYACAKRAAEAHAQVTA